MSGQIPLLPQQKSIHEFKLSRKSILLNNYDPSAYPPDLSFARVHGQAQCIGQNINVTSDVQRCWCCLEAVRKEKLSLTCDLQELIHCGESVPLYFIFVKQCIILLLFNICIMTIPSTIVNFTTGNTCQSLDGSVDNIYSTICEGSVINIMNVEVIDSMQVEATINFIAVVLSILLIAYFEIYMEDLCKTLRKEHRSSDYSVMLKGVPKDITILEVQKFVEEKLLYIGAPDVTVVKIYLIYNFKTYLALYQSKRQAIETIIQLQFQLQSLNAKNLHTTDYQTKLSLHQKTKNCEDQINQTQNKIQMMEIQINKFEETMNSLADRLKTQSILEGSTDKQILHFSGKCIVTLNSKKSKEIFVQMRGKQGFFQRLGYQVSQFLEGRKSTLIVCNAPEASDIIFGNIGSKKIIVWKNRILYNGLIVFLILVDFGFITLAKKFLKEEKAIQEGNIIFALVNAVMVAGFCSIFRRIIRASQEESFHSTQSSLHFAIVSKMIFVFMINMLLTTFVANLVSFYLIQQDHSTFEVFPFNFESFLYDSFFLIATNPILSIFMMIFDHRQIRRHIKRYRIESGLPVTQAEANLAYQNMAFDIAYKYGTTYRFLLFSAGIACIYPMVFVICLIALTAIYWTDKYLLLRRYVITIRIGQRFTLMAHKIMGQFPIYLSLTNLLVMFVPIKDGKVFEEQKYSKLYYYLAITAVCLSAFNYLIGGKLLKKVMRWATSKPEEDESESKKALYKDIENELQEDYSHHYPYFRVIKQVGQESASEYREDKIKELRNNETLGVFDIVQSYINHHRYAPQI